MRKIIVLNRISVDGYYSGPNGESHEWFVNDPKIEKAAHKMMEPDTVLMGRITYQLFESYWPKAATDKNLPIDAQEMGRELNEMTKLVFSRTLDDVNWENAVLVKNNLTEVARELKREPGGDIVIFGSGTIVQQLTAQALIDEYIFVVTPVILGEGKSFFKDVSQLKLKLLDTKAFNSGNVIFHYGIEGKETNTPKRKAEFIYE